MTILLPIFAIVALVWVLVYARHGSLLLGGAVFVAVGYVLNHNFFSVGFGPISLTLGRAMLAGLVALNVWRWWSGELRFRPMMGCDWLVALFVGYITLRFLFTGEPTGEASEVSPTWRLIASFWMPAALYFVVRNAQITERLWRGMLYCLTGLGVYLALTGLAEVTQQWWAVFPKFIADPTLGTHFGRARGPALMSASLGVFLAICFWSAWFLWARASRMMQIGLLAAMGLMLVGLYLTFTRSTWLGLAGGLAVIPFLHFPKPWRPVLLAGMLGVGLLGAIVLSDKVINMSREDTDGSAGHSVYQRASFIIVSMRMFRDHPLVGCGFGRFYDCKMPYLADRTQQIELESIRKLDHHNTFLSLLTETGIVGLMLFVALLIAWTRAAWQLAGNRQAEHWMRAQGLLALATLIVYVTNALFHDLTLSPSEQWLLYLTIGVAVGMFSYLKSGENALAVNPGPPQIRILFNDVVSSLVHPPSRKRSLVGKAVSQVISLFGMKIDAIDMATAVGKVREWCASPRGDRCRYVVTPNVDHAVMFQSDTALREAYEGAAMVLADGAPVVLASRLLNKALPERVAGSDLVPRLFAEVSNTSGSNHRPLSVFLLGAAPGVADRAATIIHERWSGVEVVGTLSPPLGFEHDAVENERILQAVAEVEPDLVLIGLGAPKQELWISRHADRLQAKAALCIGATIDFIAGEKARSPVWMQRLGLEWVHRVVTEPKRLAKRYARDAWIFPQLVYREWRASHSKA